MDNSELYKELRNEREKLNKLIDEALINGTPICQTHEIIEQTRKVRLLDAILQMSKETEKER